MKIAAVDQGDINGSARELLRRVQTGKPASQDHYSMSPCHLAPRIFVHNLATPYDI
jgi:hypothetical protein